VRDLATSRQPAARAAKRSDGQSRPRWTADLGQAGTGRQAAPSDEVEGDVSAVLERLALRLGLWVACRKDGRGVLVGTDGQEVKPWRDGYPYHHRLRRKSYEPAKRSLQVELLKLQHSLKASGERLLIVFEGRDAAGKGGTIRRFTENLHPRGARIVALDKPAEHERGPNYLDRFLPHLPARGEIVLFDRSWYSRAGVEQVMGFCQPADYRQFLGEVPDFEQTLTSDGIHLVKLWFSVTQAEQLRRLIDRQRDPLKRWKLSAVDLESLEKWEEYTAAKETMFRHTHLPYAPWTVVKSNDKKRARLEAMRYVLSRMDYDQKCHDVVGTPDPLIVGSPYPLGQAQLTPPVVPSDIWLPAAATTAQPGTEIAARLSGGSLTVHPPG
jgi:polyphosphate kinase